MAPRRRSTDGEPHRERHDPIHASHRIASHRIAFASAALVAAPAHAAANVTQVTFSGIVTDAGSHGLAAPDVGETFTASLTLFSYRGYVHSYTDGSTYSNIFGATSSAARRCC